MKGLTKLCFICAVLIGAGASGLRDASIAASDFDFYRQGTIITDCLATGYYCVYDSELAGSQNITKTISNNTHILKTSFLFGGHGVAMQGTGKTAPDGDYIKYAGGGGCFIHLVGPNAGTNLNGQWVESTQVLRDRYARLGITDFTGFGNLALLYPDQASYSRQSLISGSTGRPLTPWLSIAVDPSLIPPGHTCTLVFKNGDATPFGGTQANFRADDVGSAVKGRRIDIYLGEGQSAIDEWNRTGGNRYVDVYLYASPPRLL
jgi:3D (Asp-Asp-Asp) domain-containing protein